MELITRLLINISLFGGGMCLLMSVEQLNQKKIAPFNIRFSSTLFVNGMFLLQTGLYLSGFFQEHPGGLSRDMLKWQRKLIPLRTTLPFELECRIESFFERYVQ